MTPSHDAMVGLKIFRHIQKTAGPTPTVAKSMCVGGHFDIWYSTISQISMEILIPKDITVTKNDDNKIATPYGKK